MHLFRLEWLAETHRAPPHWNPANCSCQYVGKQRQAIYKIELLKHKTYTAPHLTDVPGENAVFLHGSPKHSDFT
jgi:hypothetical protein